ncbi:MAG: class I SAM-dependent rRNA methyltransferase [Candidatus Aureabacteria bacterium]|jgi:23S rRNA (cytosine1962-C5)-methyltransferase|nr:class I SAM-dependent rRNA methyltransferase [Candidatus Auribacterota bacterium]NLW94714.1 class I SAM-dependent rRNA methyltransferase [Chlamydiota bacterium]
MKRAAATLKRKGFAWYATGHAWVYRDDLARVENASPGDIVDLLDPRGRLLGRAFYGDRSKIALRLLTRNDEPVDDAFFERRVREAVARRRPLMEEKGALRLIYSEADGLPGLIADRYADWIVLQSLIPGSDSRVGLFASILRALLDPKGIVLRNDASARALEGLPLERKVLTGDLRGPVEVVEGDIRYLADILNGHKTGAYLDQREHRELVGRLARGKALDCFCYQGHFALHCAQRAEAVTALESSREAIAAMEKNIALNGFSNVTPVEGNAFDLLRAWQRERKRFDTIVVDPPPLARKKAHAADAMRGYKEINLRAMHLLAPGGILASFCCSHNIPPDLFGEILRAAAADACCSFRVLHALGQPPDHPVLLNVPETAYLKGLVLEKIS